MAIATQHLARSIETLESSLASLRRAPAGSVEFEVFRNAVVKGFELTLETAGKLLRRALKEYGALPREVDALIWKDVFRTAAKHGLMSDDEMKRWFAYRDNRNNTAHDYGLGFAEETLRLMPSFVEDVRRLETTVREKFGRVDS